MKIRINNLPIEVLEDYSNTIEDYLELDSQELILRIYDTICCQIQDLDLAKFSVMFSKWDMIFANVDFQYDFSSVAYELSDFELFIVSQEGSFFLHFFELDRNIEFVKAENNLFFIIRNTLGNEKIAEDTLNIDEFKILIHDLIQQFEILLQKYFPIAFEIFKANRFCI